MPAVLRALRRAVGLLLDHRATVRDERDRPAIRGEPWLAVVPGAERQLARRFTVLGGHEPEGVAIGIEARGDGLERHDGVPAVRGEAWFGRDPQAVHVVGSGGARQGISSNRWDAPSLAGYHRTMADQLSLRLEADQLPDLPDLRPMLPRPLPEPFDSDDHLFEPWWGGERALVSIGPADVVGNGEVRVRDAAGVRCHGSTPRTGRAGRPGRRALGDPRR